MRNVLTPLVKNVLIQLGLTAAASVTDAAIQKKTFGSGMTTIIISNKNVDDIMKIVNFLEDSGLLIKDVSKTIKTEAKEKIGGSLGIVSVSLAASVLVSMLTGNFQLKDQLIISVKKTQALTLD